MFIIGMHKVAEWMSGMLRITVLDVPTCAYL